MKTDTDLRAAIMNYLDEKLPVLMMKQGSSSPTTNMVRSLTAGEHREDRSEMLKVSKAKERKEKAHKPAMDGTQAGAVGTVGVATRAKERVARAQHITRVAGSRQHEWSTPDWVRNEHDGKAESEAAFATLMNPVAAVGGRSQMATRKCGQ